MDLLTNTLAFVFALGVIIFVHEGGHYLVAKAFDVDPVQFDYRWSGDSATGWVEGTDQ